MFQCLGTKYSETWFDTEGRTTATMIVAIGAFQPRTLREVHKANSEQQTPLEEPLVNSSVPYLILSELLWVKAVPFSYHRP